MKSVLVCYERIKAMTQNEMYVVSFLKSKIHFFQYFFHSAILLPPLSFSVSISVSFSLSSLQNNKLSTSSFSLSLYFSRLSSFFSSLLNRFILQRNKSCSPQHFVLTCSLHLWTAQRLSHILERVLGWGGGCMATPERGQESKSGVTG